MTEEIQEQISAFIDGELPDAEAELLVRRLAADPALQAEAAGMIRLSQAIRGETSCADTGFAARVHAAIHDEPELPSDATARPEPVARGGWTRMAAGGGIVAGVAAIALLALPDSARTPDAEGNAPALAAEAPAGLPETAESFEYTVPTTLNDSGLVSASPELAAYYLSHSVSAPSIAPGSGRARMLSADALPEDDEPGTGSETEAAR